MSSSYYNFSSAKICIFTLTAKDFAQNNDDPSANSYFLLLNSPDMSFNRVGSRATARFRSAIAPS